ncbi:MAG: hypothetical protein QOJ40_2769, partial [Verrucomicrobiota bacterium]
MPVVNSPPQTTSDSQASLDYQRIEKAIVYLQTHYLEQP